MLNEKKSLLPDGVLSRQNRQHANTICDAADGSIARATCENKNIASYCARCFSPIRSAIANDSRQFMSEDVFCYCRRRL